MVSIARGVSVSSGGGLYISSETSANGDDDECILSSRNLEDFDAFRPLQTWHIVLLQLIICVGIELAALLLFFLWPSTLGRCEPFYILIYTHSVFWMIVLIIHNFLRMKHHVLRIRGYVDFYNEIATSSKMTFYIVSATNTLLLVVVTVLCQNYDDIWNQCESTPFLKSFEYLLGIITIENVFLISCCISYMVKVCKYNKEKPHPDFRKNEWMPQYIEGSGHAYSEIGFCNTNEDVWKLVERQADIIRCLRDRNDVLCEQIIQMELSFRLP